jgi:transposase-like protein
MSIIERGRSFLQTLRALAGRTAWDWRRCPYCGGTETWRHGSYERRPWDLGGRRTVRVVRHRCLRCGRTYSEQSALLVRGSRYTRAVQRCAIDHWQHAGSSLRRTAEWLRSLLGRQERWCLWHPLDPPPASPPCRLAASTVQRWVDRAGGRARATVAGQLAGVPTSGQFGADGLWARLGGGGRRVVLLLTDGRSGVVFPPVVVAGEERPDGWARLVTRAAAAGLDRTRIRGLTSDGAVGLRTYLEEALVWVNHQRCVWHLWRGLGAPLAQAATAAAQGLAGAAATAVRRATVRALAALVRAALDASSDAAAVCALRDLAAHPLGEALARALRNEIDAALVYLGPANRGLARVAPEWHWRDFRLRLGHGRNHRTATRLERAALLWAVYHNFEPAQVRKERRRSYRRPGQSPLAMAGAPPGAVSYLDALAI